MFKNDYNSIEIARVLQHSLMPLLAAEVNNELERHDDDLPFNSATIVAEIQAVLESMKGP